MKPIIVSKCDAWQLYNSFRLIRVFTNRKKFNNMLINCINKNEIQ